MSKQTHIQRIVTHCSATPPDADYDHQSVERDHRARGWNGCGYHFVIDRDGSQHYMRELERVPAAHKPWNTDSAAICLIGGIDNWEEKNPQDNFTDAQFETWYTLISDILEGKYLSHYNMAITGHPDNILMGHRDLPGVSKDCPCFDVKEKYAKMQAKSGIPVPMDARERIEAIQASLDAVNKQIDELMEILK